MPEAGCPGGIGSGTSFRPQGRYHGAVWCILTLGRNRRTCWSGEDHAPGCAIRREMCRRNRQREMSVKTRETGKIRRERSARFAWTIGFPRGARRRDTMRGETITLTFFENGYPPWRDSGVLFFSSRARSSPSRRLSTRRRKGAVTQQGSKDARNGYARPPSSSRARIKRIGTSAPRSWHTCRTTRASYTHICRTENEGEREREREKRSYRRYNTFVSRLVSRGKVPRRGSVRCERAASTDRARYDASTWPRASRPTIPSAPRYRPPHYRGPLQTSLVYAKCYYRQIPKLHSDLKLVLVKSFKMKSVLKTKWDFLWSIKFLPPLPCYFLPWEAVRPLLLFDKNWCLIHLILSFVTLTVNFIVPH